MNRALTPNRGDCMETRFRIPEAYFSFRKKETFIRFVKAYVSTAHSGWKPIRIEGKYVVCKWVGKDRG